MELFGISGAPPLGEGGLQVEPIQGCGGPCATAEDAERRKV